MKYLLDTANLDAIRYYTDIFPIAGVTSNPSIVKKEGKIDFFAHMSHHDKDQRSHTVHKKYDRWIDSEYERNQHRCPKHRKHMLDTKWQQ